MKRDWVHYMSLVVAIDFDGTIVEHIFPNIGKAVPGAFKWMKKFQDSGARLVLYTMRSDGQESGDVLNEAVQFCRKNGIEFWGINTNPEQLEWTSSPKAYAQIYIDDAAYGCPLVENKNDRPYVDWSIVGPAVLEKIQSYKRD